jgi:hypothetical protein
MTEELFYSENEIDFSKNYFENNDSNEDSHIISPKKRPINVIEDQIKDVTDTQLLSKILDFPFNLVSCNLIKLKDERDLELCDKNIKIIFGDIKSLSYNDSILKLIFSSRDKLTTLNLVDHLHEIESLTENSGIQFICILMNNLYIQYVNENLTYDAYTSLQNISNVLELLNDEEPPIESNNDNSENKDNKMNNSDEQKIICEKKSKKTWGFNKFDFPYSKSSKDNNMNATIISNDNTKLDTNKDNLSSIIPNTMTNSSPSLFMTYSINKSQSKLNPNYINPSILQAALVIQNIMKIQQMNLTNNIDTKIQNQILEHSKDPFTSKSNTINTNGNTSQNSNDTENNTSLNLEQIICNKKYKEYIPKVNKVDKVDKDTNNVNNVNNVKFQTNSTRDYRFKYVSRYIVQIDNEKNFPVTKMIIGNNGKLLRKILLDNCINFGDNTTKIRLRGKGSGYKEGPKNEESKEPMELCLSSLNYFSYLRCSNAIEKLLLDVYQQYYMYQCNNNHDNPKMKKILKYAYVVNRYNTMVKEEKRRKKEEELKQLNQNVPSTNELEVKKY